MGALRHLARSLLICKAMWLSLPHQIAHRVDLPRECVATHACVFVTASVTAGVGLARIARIARIACIACITGVACITCITGVADASVELTAIQWPCVDRPRVQGAAEPSQ